MADLVTTTKLDILKQGREGNCCNVRLYWPSDVLSSPISVCIADKAVAIIVDTESFPAISSDKMLCSRLAVNFKIKVREQVLNYRFH